MKTRKIICFASIILSLLLVFGCNATNTDGEVNGRSDVKEEFLTIYFTTNYEGRYDAWLESSAPTLDEQALTELVKAQDAYYSTIRDLVSNEFYDTLVANRDIYKYDKLAFNNNETMCPTDFVFTEYPVSDSKTTYAFEVGLEITSKNQVKTSMVNGQITTEEVDGKILVSGLYLSKAGFLHHYLGIDDFRNRFNSPRAWLAGMGNVF